MAIGLLIVDSRMSSLAALRQGLGTALYPLQRTLLLPRDGLSLGAEYFSEVNRLRTENSELRRVEAANAKALLQAEQMASENARLRELLGARERSAVRSVIAEVLYDARDPFTRKLVLDKGLQNGVLVPTGHRCEGLDWPGDSIVRVFIRGDAGHRPQRNDSG